MTASRVDLLDEPCFDPRALAHPVVSSMGGVAQNPQHSTPPTTSPRAPGTPLWVALGPRLRTACRAAPTAVPLRSDHFFPHLSRGSIIILSSSSVHAHPTKGEPFRPATNFSRLYRSVPGCTVDRGIHVIFPNDFLRWADAKRRQRQSVSLHYVLGNRIHDTCTAVHVVDVELY